MTKPISRRGALLSTGAGIIGLGALAACSTQAVPYGANEAGVVPDDNPTAGASMMGATTAPSQSQQGQGMAQQTQQAQAQQTQAQQTQGIVLGEAKTIPVGSGVIYTADKVVVTQPVSGEYRAFSAVCTHVGCILNEIADGTIDCPCHGSKFTITTGAVVAGPAPTPLPKKKIKIEDGQVILL
jgi:Rieske Fe-S protein